MTRQHIPSLNWIRAFEAAGRHESFARAAQALNVSPAALSKQIAALEGHLGEALFDRGPHSVSLTAAGRAFLPVVHEALGSVEGAAGSLFGTRGDRPLILRAPFIFHASWLAERLPLFRSRVPGLRLQIRSFPRADDEPGGTDELEVAFGSGGRVGGLRLFGERIVPVARPEIAARIDGVEALVRETLIEIGFHRTSWQALLGPRGVDFRDLALLHTESTQMALSLAACGNGIALARQPVSDRLQAQFGLVPCLPDLALDGEQAFFLVERFSRAPSKGARAFRDWLLEQARAAE